MLLKFATTDMFNTSLIDVATGERAYEINTVSVPSPPAKPKPFSALSSDTAAPSQEKNSPVKYYHVAPEPADRNVVFRQTQIRDTVGIIVAEIQWEGRCPHFTIDGQKIGGLQDLFGTSSARFM